MITDPLFYAIAIPAVILVGISKGGLGAGATLGVPLMSLVISPVQAASILLPILMVMDLVGLYAYRRAIDWTTLGYVLPAALLGVLIGWATTSWVTADHVRLIVGTVAVVFGLSFFLRGPSTRPVAKNNLAKGSFWGAIAGFTSFVSHAGGLPLQVYLGPLRLDPQVFVGTSTVFFAITNYMKLPGYWALGQITATNLLTSAVLLPFAAVATLIGIWLVRRVDRDLFYRIIYTLVLVVGVKLAWDGATGILSA
jgi:uncharacterized membrane protein YfcA